MAKYSMKDLGKQYGNFALPCYTIKINDTQLNAKYTQNSIEVQLTSDYEASGCIFTIENAFLTDGMESLKLQEDLKRLLKIGNKTEIAIGYHNGGVKKVFAGYIDSISVDYHINESIVYTVECLDGKGIMMNSFRSESKTGIKKYSAAVENTVKRYSSLIKIKSNQLYKGDSELTVKIEQHNESDYHFVCRLAKRLNHCFFIENGALIFMPYTKLSKETNFCFDINEYLLGFRMQSSLKNQVSAVTVRANNASDPSKPFEATVKSYNSMVDSGVVSAKAATVINEAVTKNIIDLSATSQAAAQEAAQACMNEISYGLYHGSVKVAGVPELFPGYVAELKGFGSEFDRKYFIAKVTHKIRDNHYTTECELEVNRK